jgi:hypothetical protein
MDSGPIIPSRYSRSRDVSLPAGISVLNRSLNVKYFTENYNWSSIPIKNPSLCDKRLLWAQDASAEIPFTCPRCTLPQDDITSWLGSWRSVFNGLSKITFRILPKHTTRRWFCRENIIGDAQDQECPISFSQHSCCDQWALTALLSDQHYRPELPDGYPIGGTDFGFHGQCKSIKLCVSGISEGYRER